MKGKRNKQFCLSRLTLACQLALTAGVLVSTQDVFAETYFNPYALQQGISNFNAPADLSIFDQGGQISGSYRTDIYINKTFKETRSINFVLQEGKLVAELTAKQWIDFGVNAKAFPQLSALTPDTMIVKPEEYIPAASTQFDFYQMRLDVSIPQAALSDVARHAIDPASWDQGIPMIFMNYSVSGSQASQKGDGGSRNLFVGMNSGANLGSWRLRNYTTYARQSATGKREAELGLENAKPSTWSTFYTYAQRDIHSLRSQLTVGEGNSPGDIFDSVPFSGIQLTSDDNMLPDSLRGFAPVVRGIAASNAQVTVRQNGAIIYQTYVAPGAFAIRDLYPTSSSGNLEVTIREANGHERTFVQAFSAVPGMLREGQWRYAITSGRYRSSGVELKPSFLQSTLQYGIANATTLYGGLILSDNYKAGALGIGQGLGKAGSISLDVTQAEAQLADASDKKHRGQSYRLQYAKDVFQSGTTFTLAGYRYSTSGFFDFNEANEMGVLNVGGNYSRRHTKRSRMQAQISQNLGEYGSLYLSAYQQDYWQLAGSERTLTAGYSFNIYGINYGLNFSESSTPINRSDRQIALSLQIPLNRWLAGAYANYNAMSSRRRVSHQAGIGGSALEGNNLNYNLSQGYTNQGEGAEGSLASTLRGGYGNVNGSYSYNKYGRQLSAGAEGAVVLHPNGLTFAQPLGQSSVLVRAPGASNVKVSNQTGVSTDWRGYAVVPYASTYRENRIALDPSTLPDNVDMEHLVRKVVPTEGAMVLADFKPRIGSRVLMQLSYADKPIPFGASAVLIAEGKDITSGIVGEGGELYLSGVPEEGLLKVKWGHEASQQCSSEVRVPYRAEVAVQSLEARCS